MDSPISAALCSKVGLSAEGEGSGPSVLASLDDFYTSICSSERGLSSGTCYLEHTGKVSFFASKNALVENNRKNKAVSRRKTQEILTYYSDKLEETCYYLKLLNRFIDDRSIDGFSSVDKYFIERCVTLRDISVKVCENGHRDIIYHHCGEERLCPRCIARDIQERSEEVMAKYSRFGIKGWKKRVYTVPEELRKAVYEDLNKFANLIYNVEYRFHHHTMLAGVCFIHECSTQEPYEIKPHAEIYIGDLGLKEKHRVQISLWEEKEDIESLRELYREELEKTYGVELKEVVVRVSYIDDYEMMRYHHIPYALKAPIVPEWVRYVAYDYGTEGIVEYSNEKWRTVASVKDFEKCLMLKYYSKKNFHRLRYFGFLANSVWRIYYERVYGEKPERRPRVKEEEEFYCRICGDRIIQIITNVFKHYERYRRILTNVEFDEFLEPENVALGEKICKNCERYPCLRDRAMLPKDKCGYLDKFIYKKVLWMI